MTINIDELSTEVATQILKEQNGALMYFLKEFIEAWETGSGGDGYLYTLAKDTRDVVSPFTYN